VIRSDVARAIQTSDGQAVVASISSRHVSVSRPQARLMHSLILFGLFLLMPSVSSCAQDAKAQALQCVKAFIQIEAGSFSVPLGREAKKSTHLDFIPPYDEGGAFSACIVDSGFTIDGITEGRGDFDFLNPHEEDLVFVELTFNQLAYWHRGRIDIQKKRVKVEFICANQNGEEKILDIRENVYYSFVRPFIAYLESQNSGGKFNQQIAVLKKILPN